MSNESLYTLGQFRSNVYKALDEYSSNGVEHDRFSDGMADIDKRFVSVLNMAMRRLYLSAARYSKYITVCFTMPKILFCNNHFILTSGENGHFFPPDKAGAMSFSALGNGKLTIGYSDGTREEKPIRADYGQYCVIRKIFEKAPTSVTFSAQGTLSVKTFRIYSNEELPQREELLPDGKRLFCEFPPLCAELYAVRRGDEFLPCELFSFEKGILSCDESCAGEYVIEYIAYPRPIEETDSPETPIDLPPAASDALVYAVAAELCDRSDGEAYSRLLYKYRELLTNTYSVANLRRTNLFYARKYSSARYGKRGSLRL